MPLTATLDVDPSPDAVTFHFHVRTDSTGSETVQIRSAKVADLVVIDGDEAVWRWSDGQAFAQMLQDATFEPDTTETYEFEWPNPTSGDYEAVATLNAMNDVSARESFTV